MLGTGLLGGNSPAAAPVKFIAAGEGGRAERAKSTNSSGISESGFHGGLAPSGMTQPLGPTLAEAPQLGKETKHKQKAYKEGTSICDPQPRVGRTGVRFLKQKTQTNMEQKRRKPAPPPGLPARGAAASPVREERSKRSFGTRQRCCAPDRAELNAKSPSGLATHTPDRRKQAGEGEAIAEQTPDSRGQPSHAALTSLCRLVRPWGEGEGARPAFPHPRHSPRETSGIEKQDS